MAHVYKCPIRLTVYNSMKNVTTLNYACNKVTIIVVYCYILSIELNDICAFRQAISINTLS